MPRQNERQPVRSGDRKEEKPNRQEGGYAAPRLVTYGKLSQLVRGGDGSPVDGSFPEGEEPP